MFPQPYAELHCHSHFSFQEGTSSTDQLLTTASDLGYAGLALTDHDNLSGSMQFAQTSRSLGFHGIVGVELTLEHGYHLTALAETAEGYSNLCRIVSLSHMLTTSRHVPEVDPHFLQDHSNGLIFLSGCKRGAIPALLEQGQYEAGIAQAKAYLEWISPKSFYIELQQNLVRGDTQRNKMLWNLANELNLGIVATNNVHYHIRSYAQLNDCLVSIKHNMTLEETHLKRRPNSEFFLKTPQEMAILFQDCPTAISNSNRISERCIFDLTRDLTYTFPEYFAPDGYTPETYLKSLCYAAARRRYGDIWPHIEIRLEEEFRLLRKHNLFGFLLHYYDIVQLARKVMINLGLSDPEIPLEERPPGRGRGSSVALLVGYLIGLSHIDPLKYDLSLERFLPDDLIAIALDIDLDFPRNIRESLILAVHHEWGWDHAALAGMRSTYQIKGAIRDLGKVLDLPKEEVDLLAKKVDHTSGKNIGTEIQRLPGFRDKINHPGWEHLIQLTPKLDGIPRYIAQHPGGMVISSRPLTDIVPVQKGAIHGRYIIQWDKDDIDAVSMVKIDFLSLGALSQLQEALLLIEQRTGHSVDISRIDFDDPRIYDMLCSGDTVGIFQVESAAQMQTITRLKPRNLQDMAYETACVRPGVGVHDGVRHFIRRRSGLEPITYDHPLEKRALSRTLGIVLYQDQINQLAIDVGDLSPYDADQMRRAFSRKNSTPLLHAYWKRFRRGAAQKGVDLKTTRRIFRKFNGHYMFPEAHAIAFGVTSYQLAWLKFYYPHEFITALFNQQPMGFWGLETLKEDAKTHGITILNPDINLSESLCIIEGTSIRLGLLSVRNVGKASATKIEKERDSVGTYQSLGDFMQRTGSQQVVIESLIRAGAFDALNTDRRSLLWETGLRYHPVTNQIPLDLPIVQDIPLLTQLTDWEQMEDEYQVLSIYPSGHFIANLRPYLESDVVTSRGLKDLKDGQKVTVVGLVARPLQHPLSQAYFITLQDETGFIPLVIWPRVYSEYRDVLREPLLVIEGAISRREGTLNVVVTKARTPYIPHQQKPIQDILKLPRSLFQ